MAAEDLPSEFDIVILGTGLAESVVAAAFSRVGQRVLHVDRRSYYAASWASFTFSGLLTWIQQHQEESQPEEDQDWSSLLEEGEELIYLSHSDPASVSNLQVFCYTSEEDEEEAPSADPPNTTEEEAAGGAEEDATKETPETESADSVEDEKEAEPEEEQQVSQTEGEEPEAGQPTPSAALSQSEPTRKKISYAQLVKEGRRFNIDLVSKLMYSRGSLVDLLIKSNVSRYAEFKNVTRILTYRHGKVEQVPCSRADVFASRQLSMVEKRKLMRFLTSCVEETEEQRAYNGRPYLEFLCDQQLGDNLQHFLLHSIAMVTEDTPTEVGLASTRHFLRCLGRYGNTPFLFPVYGLGEIPQCFCRMCAVFGGIYCLRHSINCLLVDKDTNSTENALLKVFNDLLTSADTGSLNILILLDLSAAFDTVSHNILLTRLQDLGIEGTALTWLRSYLSNRSHFISLHNHTSATVTVPQGVPQGSVLGPLLFIIYILPLGQILHHFNLNFHCYADDTQIYLSTKSPHNPSLSHINSCLLAIKTWMQNNFLKLNSNKTEFLLIGSKSTLSKANNPTLTIDGTIVSPSPQAFNLGVIFDSTLSLEPHICHVIKTSLFHLRNIAKIRPSLTPSAAERLIHTFTSSRLDYCNSLFLGINSIYIKRLQLVQNSAPRLITCSKSWHHITPVLKQLHWLPISHRITSKILVLTYKAIHHQATSYLTVLLSPYQPSRSLRFTSAGLLYVPKSKLSSLGERAFSRAAPRLWNSLPHEIHTSESLTIFQSRLKTHLFSSAYP
ncbi:rab proteins geranylgeranyltransferase component A 1 isoform X2 [Micropterus salmoides]|uniref:rab proteins geranylgeranyltransferase component A 1 isoform X2 n=1 Tax=Micropterus salmoides TaxID=27706 RepID=UPI0018ECBED6|nr:rab proteins geranylgeranyltransferase component A 1 isoform X2 [Micropterus salmoides]